MLPNEAEWTIYDEMVKKYKHLIFASQGTFLISTLKVYIRRYLVGFSEKNSKALKKIEKFSFHQC
jgi:hypothetical protein